MSATPGPWVADPGIGWRILLAAEVGDDAAVDRGDLARRLDALAAAQGWPAPPAPAPATAAALVEPHAAPLRVGLLPRGVVLSSHHAAVDGLGLLTALDRLGLGPATSSARGVGGRARAAGAAATVARRLGEAAVRPPARLTTPPLAHDRTGDTRSGDTLVARTVDRTLRTADLVRAAARAAVDHEASYGHRARRVAIAVGASREPDATDRLLRDRSALLRLRDVEQMDDDAIVAALRSAPLQTPPVAGPHRPWTPLVARGAGVGLRLLAPRLGSTMLVSHLGEVDAPRVERIAFHPVTAGGTGISLGAVGLRGRTSLTLRARAAAWDDDGLERLLEAVISLL